MSSRRKLKLLRLLEPDLCEGCRFNVGNVTVKEECGEQKVMVHCMRRDCDNWDTSTAQEAEILEVDDGA